MRNFIYEQSRPAVLKLLLTNSIRNMKKEKVFVENINMETQTVFHTNGDINIYPCDFERGQHIVAGGTRASQKGRMITEDDDIKESESTVIFTLRFPKRMGKALIEALYNDESEEIKAYIKTRRTTTEW